MSQRSGSSKQMDVLHLLILLLCTTRERRRFTKTLILICQLLLLAAFTRHHSIPTTCSSSLCGVGQPFKAPSYPEADSCLCSANYRHSTTLHFHHAQSRHEKRGQTWRWHGKSSCQGKSALQGLRGVSSTLYVAKKVGTSLGRSHHLQQELQCQTKDNGQKRIATTRRV